MVLILLQILHDVLYVMKVNNDFFLSDDSIGILFCSFSSCAQGGAH